MPTRPLPNEIYTPSGVSYTAGHPPNETWRDDEYGPHVAITDEDAISSLDRLVEGPVETWSELENAEQALRALILHDMSYMQLPSVMTIQEGVMVYPGNRVTQDMGSVRSYMPLQPVAIGDVLRSANCKNYYVYTGWVYLRDNAPIEGDQFWIDNYDVLAGGDEVATRLKFSRYVTETRYGEDYAATPSAIECSSYFSDSAITDIQATITKRHLPRIEEKVLRGLDQGWADQLTKLGEVGLGIQVGPFLAIVLSRARTREKIPSAILEIREEMAKAREEFRNYSSDLANRHNVNEALRAAEALDRAVNSVIPAAFPRVDKPLRFGWGAVKAAWDVWAEGNMAAGVRFLGDVILKSSEHIRNANSFKSTKYLADELRNVDMFNRSLNRLLTREELGALGF